MLCSGMQPVAPVFSLLPLWVGFFVIKASVLEANDHICFADASNATSTYGAIAADSIMRMPAERRTCYKAVGHPSRLISDMMSGVNNCGQRADHCTACST